MQFIHINKTNFSRVSQIYLEGIQTGIATFETKTSDWETWDNTHFSFGRIALSQNNKILAWAALSPVSDRCVYGGVAEVSIYVSKTSRGKGLGEILLQELIRESEKNNIWTLQSGIFSQNTASIQLHLKCGFRVIGYREKIGQINGIWYDNTLLERRSKIINHTNNAISKN